jgi:hypothetical protein
MSTQPSAQIDLDESPAPLRRGPWGTVSAGLRRVWRWRQSAIGSRNPWVCILWATLECALISFIVAYALRNFGPARTDFGKDLLADVINAGIGAPVTETFLFQFIPILFLRRYGAGPRLQIIISTILFAWAHFRISFVTGIDAGLTGGIYFAFVFAHWAPKSKWTAYWTTTVTHAFYNLLVILIVLCFGGYPSNITLRQRCLDYVASPKRVVYEHDPQEIQKLLSSDPNYHHDIFDPTGSEVVYTPPQWSEYFELFSRDGVAFMHERISPSGNRALVVIQLRSSAHDTVYLTSMVAPINTEDTQWGATHQPGIPLRAHAGNLRVFAGQIDAGDKSHFTIEYDDGSGSVLIDGRLGDDGNVQLSLRDPGKGP